MTVNDLTGAEKIEKKKFFKALPREKKLLKRIPQGKQFVTDIFFARRSLMVDP